MKIGGFQKTSLLDYPEEISSTIWTVGCNFNCPFCYNKDLVNGKTTLISEKEVFDYLQDKLAKYAIPRYFRFVNDFPKTSTHRIQKKELENIGITDDTFDVKAKPKSKIAAKSKPAAKAKTKTSTSRSPAAKTAASKSKPQSKSNSRSKSGKTSSKSKS